MRNTKISIVRIVNFALIALSLSLPNFSVAEQSNETIEPKLNEVDSINLFNGHDFTGWKVPSANWSIVNNTIVGSTADKKLAVSEWLYTEQRFGDFEFSTEVKLIGDSRRNSGIYFRVNTFLFISARDGKSFEAPSGYEFDLARHNPGKRNFWGALGDWFARKSLRIFADQDLISKTYTPQEWNRLTLRARGNRIEYWINGIKVMDYIDTDPKASREGSIGFQLHDGSVMQVAYKNVRVRSLH